MSVGRLKSIFFLLFISSTVQARSFNEFYERESLPNYAEYEFDDGYEPQSFNDVNYESNDAGYIDVAPEGDEVDGDYQMEMEAKKEIQIPCNYQSGDGIGGSETYIQKTETREECTQLCFKKRATDPSINGATYGYGNRAKECYCEKNMNERNTNTLWKSCMFDSKRVSVPYLTVRKSNQIAVIPKWHKNWRVSFQVKPSNGIFYQYTNIIHFSVGGDYSVYGDRVPSVFFIGGTHRLHISSAINGRSNYYWRTSQSIQKGVFTHVLIRQRKNKQGQYVYSISLNGKQVFSIINTDPREFTNVKVWASNPWYASSGAVLKGLEYESGEPKIDAGNTFAPPCIELRPRPNCNNGNTEFRTIEGICNNLQMPTWGATATALRRIVDADYVDGITTPRGFPGTNPKVPTAHEVSNRIFQVETKNGGNSNRLTVLFMTFGQFLDHDLTEVKMQMCRQADFGRCPDLNVAFKYPCLPLLFNSSSDACTAFGRSEPACVADANNPGLRKLPNELTAFVDASQIYDVDKTRAKNLRKNDGSGELKVETRSSPVGDLLPIREIPLGFSGCSVVKEVMGERTTVCRTIGGCSLVGDVRGDENIALHGMHTVWVREHNRIARDLRKHNPAWNDERLYQTTRKIVGALWAKAVYTEFLPQVTKLSTYQGYDMYSNPSISNTFAAAAFRYGHSLIPNSFEQNNKNFDRITKEIPLQEAFFTRAGINFHGIERTIFGLVSNQSSEVDNNFAKGIARKLFVRPGEVFHNDLLALNIQRGRDHGLPTYGSYRKFCKLSAITSWSDLKSIMLPGAADLFKEIYDDPNKIDLFAAGISEIHAAGFEVGETFGCLIRSQFEAVRDGDRFFYKNPKVFTDAQLKAIEATTLSTVLCANLNGIVSIQLQALRVPDNYMNPRVTCKYGIPKLNLAPWYEH